MRLYFNQSNASDKNGVGDGRAAEKKQLRCAGDVYVALWEHARCVPFHLATDIEPAEDTVVGNGACPWLGGRSRGAAARPMPSRTDMNRPQ